MSNDLTVPSSSPVPTEGSVQPPAPAFAPADLLPPAPKASGVRMAVDAVMRWKWLVLAVSLTGILATTWVVWHWPNQYSAQATLWVETRGQVGVGGDARGPIGSGSVLLSSPAWIDLLKSYAVLDRVAQRLRLHVHPASAAAARVLTSFALKDRFLPGRYRFEVDEDGQAFTLSARNRTYGEHGVFGDSAGVRLGFAWVPQRGVLAPGKSVDFEVLAPRDEAKELADNLSVSANPTQLSFMRLELTGADPARTAATLNAIVDRYVEVAAELKRSKLDELTVILREQLTKAETNLHGAETALEGFRVNTITLPSDRASPIAAGLEVTRDPVFTNYFSLQTERDQIRRDREEIRRILNDVRTKGTGVEALEVVPSVAHNSELLNQLQTLTTRRAELRALRQQYTDEHPEIRRRTAEIDNLEQVVIPRLAQGLTTDLDARDASLSELIGSASASLKEIPPRAIEEARLQRQVTITGQLYETLQQRYEEGRLAAVSSLPDVRVLDRATIPEVPISNRQKLRLLLMGLAGSTGMAVGLALVLGKLDRRLRYPGQVGERMGLPIIGTIPQVRMSRTAIDEDEAAEVLEALRTVRLSLIHACGAAPPLIVTITSPGSGDGKSFVASNLALAFASAGLRTLVIDGDTRRGTVHRLLDAQSFPGLAEYLCGEAPPEDVIRPTRFDNLDMVTRGRRTAGVADSLSSQSLLKLIHSLRPRYAAIIVDSPPLGAGADAYLLGTITGNMLLVLRTGQTDLEYAEAKLEPLTRLPVRVVGAVVNAVPANGPYRYYRYLRGYGQSDEAPEPVLAITNRR
jgi:capsular exopolysaccharide synthesis family protein